MRTNIDHTILGWRETWKWHRWMGKICVRVLMAGVGLFLAAAMVWAAVVIAKLYARETAFESFAYDIGRIYAEEGIDAVKALCGAKAFSEEGLVYNCWIDKEKKNIHVQQFARQTNGSLTLVGEKLLLMSLAHRNSSS